MDEVFSRTEMLLGERRMGLLREKRVILFGVGGVGSYVCEALVRVGIGHITVVDSDVVSELNINRQLIALHSTIGKDKVEVAKERALDILPDCDFLAIKAFVTPENIADFNLEQYDYAIDAVDNVTAKIAIIENCCRFSVPLISSMGTGNKLDASRFQIADIYKTSVCPLARVMRNELKKRRIKKQKVLFSTETPCSSARPPASISFVPSVAGLLIAGEAVRELCGISKENSLT